MKYSVVIPVYNAERYLDECIMGIVGQKGDYQIILVNDGSKDKSGEICDRYAEKYPFIKVKHIENSGAGNARNVGAAMAEGEFIIFCDADDYISKDFFEKLSLSDVDFTADVVFFNMVKFFPDGRQEGMNDGIIREKLYHCGKEKVYEHLASCNKFPASCCGKIINRSFYKNSGIQMSGELMGEDIDWTLRLVLKAEKFDFFEEGFYYYRKTPNTRSSHKNVKNARDQLFIIGKWVNEPDVATFKNYFESFLAYQYSVIYPAYGSLSKEHRKQLYPKMKKFRYLLKNGKTRKIKMINFLVNLVGINMASAILYNYVTYRDRGGNN